MVEDEGDKKPSASEASDNGQGEDEKDSVHSDGDHGETDSSSNDGDHGDSVHKMNIVPPPEDHEGDDDDNLCEQVQDAYEPILRVLDLGISG